VSQLATGLSDLPVAGVACKNWAIGFPEVAEALALLVSLRNSAPEASAGPGRTVSDYKRHDLPGPTAEGDPEPPFVRPFSGARPALIEFKDIVLLSRPEPISYWLGFASLFSSHRLNVLRLTPKMRLTARFEPRSR